LPLKRTAQQQKLQPYLRMKADPRSSYKRRRGIVLLGREKEKEHHL